ncbi:putative nicotinamide N-methyase [Microbacterium resistens]|uniref:Nicotinamide N-methyase n=1 Tax=Microbacterium resistens TaxID=156977 RepID=A0ABU1SGL5_9MICO|nr:holin [Microbacterium resistens]MDR6868730.1 putative nicotinamide N-methyase [Microbacterium resistens]
MTNHITRAQLRETNQRPLFTARFWADIAERVITSAAGGALAVVTLDGFNLIAGDTPMAIAIGAGTAALISLFKGVAAAGGGTGSASLVPSV